MSKEPSISILVCYHRISKPIIASRFLQPIIVGAALMEEQKLLTLKQYLQSTNPKYHLRFQTPPHSAQVLRDDSGDNISALNPYYCELSALYWAWKNLQADYYGLFHYRRVFDLNPNNTQRSHIVPTKIPVRNNNLNANEFGLDDENIMRMVSEYECITSYVYPDHKVELDTSSMSVYDVYAHFHHANDLNKAITYINTHYPHMQNALQKALFSKPSAWHLGNMFIMRKDMFFEYCEWIFDVLFGIEKEIDYKHYDAYQARVMGFLAERLFNVFTTYKQEQAASSGTPMGIYRAPLLLLLSEKPFIGWDTNHRYKRFYFLGMRLYKRAISHN